MASENMPHWYKDCFEWKAIEKKQIKNKALCLPIICPKAGHRPAKVSPFLSQPGKTEVNYQRKL